MEGDDTDRDDEAQVEEISPSYWEPSNIFDRLCVAVYGLFESGSGVILALLAVVAVIPLMLVFVVGLVVEPVVGVLTVLSVVPGFFIVWYIWEVDVYEKEPLTILIATYLFASVLIVVPATVNTITRGFFAGIPVVGFALFFYMVVAPVEELIKLLAVRIYAYTTEHFRTPMDGAVYGAAAGLGFATAENFTYILIGGPAGLSAELTAIGRAGVAPGHVIWSSIAGYFLGLARNNPGYAGVLVFKGLLVAGLLHGAYNIGITEIPRYAETFGVAETTEQAATFVFLIAVYAASGGYLLHHLWGHEREVLRSRGAKPADD